MRRLLALIAAAAAVVGLSAGGCGDDADGTSSGAGAGDPVGTQVVFDLEADWSTPEGFYAAPWPLDLRLTPEGAPDWRGFPNPGNSIVVEQFKASVQSQRGFPMIPVALFTFDGPLAPRTPDQVLSGGLADPIVLMVLDEPSSPAILHIGETVPVVAQTLVADNYTAENVLAIAPRPGFVLRPNTKYAVLVKPEVMDAEGRPLARSELLHRLHDFGPENDAERELNELMQPLWYQLGDDAQLAAATVFTTGDVVSEMIELQGRVSYAHPVTIDGLELVTDPEREHPDLCELRGTVTYPQFQSGQPPFDEGGLFQLAADGMPQVQRMEEAPIRIYIPRAPMPPSGYPLVLSIHGSGGYSDAAIAPLSDDGLQHFGLGPAGNFTHVGMAVATSAMPLNPERYPGASETEYLNPNNFAAMRDTFRQGQLETHLFLDALLSLQIDPAVLAGCEGPEVEGGVDFFFDDYGTAITGQSMGGMYANQVAATSSRIEVAAPTGAGGHWTYFILVTDLIDNLDALFRLILGTTVELTHLHPALSLAAAGLEAADPIVFMPRIAKIPTFFGVPRPIYAPVGLGDSYFPPSVYDAVAIAYGSPQAGDVIWPEMQDALALDGRDGVLDFPVENNLVSEYSEIPYTGVITQWEGDGEHDPHAIYVRREEVRFQYTCFFESYFRTGTATVFPPVRWDDVEECPN